MAAAAVVMSELRHDFPGTAELLPTNSRRSRLSRDFVPSESDPSAVAPEIATTPAAAAASTLSDDTVREYGHLLQMDTKNFSEKQKALFERIVERVARLSATVENSTVTEGAESEGRATKNRLKKNSQKTVSVTPRPTKHTTTAAADSTMTKVTTIKAKPSVTIQTTDVVNKVHSKLQAAAAAAAAAAAKTNVTEVIFGNITTSSIVDSLSADTVPREDIYAKRPLAATAATAAIADTNKVKVS